MLLYWVAGIQLIFVFVDFPFILDKFVEHFLLFLGGKPNILTSSLNSIKHLSFRSKNLKLGFMHLYLFGGINMLVCLLQDKKFISICRGVNSV